MFPSSSAFQICSGDRHCAGCRRCAVFPLAARLARPRRFLRDARCLRVAKPNCQRSIAPYRYIKRNRTPDRSQVVDRGLRLSRKVPISSDLRHRKFGRSWRGKFGVRDGRHLLMVVPAFFSHAKARRREEGIDGRRGRSRLVRSAPTEPTCLSAAPAQSVATLPRTPPPARLTRSQRRRRNKTG